MCPNLSLLIVTLTPGAAQFDIQWWWIYVCHTLIRKMYYVIFNSEIILTSCIELFTFCLIVMIFRLRLAAPILLQAFDPIRNRIYAMIKILNGWFDDDELTCAILWSLRCITWFYTLRSSSAAGLNIIFHIQPRRNYARTGLPAPVLHQVWVRIPSGGGRLEVDFTFSSPVSFRTVPNQRDHRTLFLFTPSIFPWEKHFYNH